VKKKLYWQTTYGTIEVEEQILKDKISQKRVRPFSQLAEVVCRGYSLPVQRAMTDFGSDDSFCDAAKKMKEHYGIDISTTATQRITELHAEMIHSEEELEHQRRMMHPKQVADVIVSEIDGSMLPIVEIVLPADKTANELDLRKYRKLQYKEARLALSHQKDSVTPVYAATMGDVNEAGKQLRFSAESVGFGEKTKVHGVGDGAVWIASQFEEQFGPQSTYLIDFYHLCEYLSEASKGIPTDSKIWIEQQKTFLKNSQPEQVLAALKPYLEALHIPDEKAPVRACYRYIDNRPGQFFYKEALEKGLPIGSGEVESEHRYISQERLKLAGAWWKIANAANMLSLRVLRANNHWESYWNKNSSKAA
jgi:hypothetical protein